MVKKYERLTASMVSLIENGVIKKNEKMPSLREFASSFHVSVNTAKAVYDALERDRYVRVVPQSGYYVEERAVVPRASAVDALSLLPCEVGLNKIALAMASSGLLEPSASDLCLSYLARDLVPAKTLRQFVDQAICFNHDMTVPILESRGYAPLREQIAVHALSMGIPVNPEGVIVTSGCQESVRIALQTVAPTGSFVAIESPAPFSVLRTLEALRLKPLEIPCVRGEGISIEALAFALDRYPVAAVVTNGNFMNPCGELLAEENKRELVRLCGGRDIPLVEDDASGDLFFGSGMRRPATCLSLDHDGTVIYCSSFSNTVAPNLRLGWIIPGKWFNPVDRLLQLMNHGLSAIPQISMALLLEDGFLPRHLRRVRGALRVRVPAARSAILSSFPEGTTVSEPRGGTSLWVTLPGDKKSYDLYVRALSRGILIAPGRLFGAEQRYYSSFRLNASVFPDGDFSVIRTLGEIASELPES